MSGRDNSRAEAQEGNGWGEPVLGWDVWAVPIGGRLGGSRDVVYVFLVTNLVTETITISRTQYDTTVRLYAGICCNCAGISTT